MPVLPNPTPGGSEPSPIAARAIHIASLDYVFPAACVLDIIAVDLMDAGELGAETPEATTELRNDLFALSRNRIRLLLTGTLDTDLSAYITTAAIRNRLLEIAAGRIRYK